MDGGEITELLRQVRKGDKQAESKLLDVVYRKLRLLAGVYMSRERSGHSLQPTALVNEAYIHLLGQGNRNWQNRRHFLAAASQVMRRILVDHARSKRSEKRGGSRVSIDGDDVMLFTPAISEDLIALDEGLTRLAQWDLRQSRIVELRFFGGLTEEETADVIGVAVRTVKRDWKLAKAWLYSELKKGQNSDTSEMGTNKADI